jgi:hypothetical protein
MHKPSIPDDHQVNLWRTRRTSISLFYIISQAMHNAKFYLAFFRQDGVNLRNISAFPLKKWSVNSKIFAPFDRALKALSKNQQQALIARQSEVE